MLSLAKSQDPESVYFKKKKLESETLKVQFKSDNSNSNLVTADQRVQRRGADGRGRRALRRAARGVGDGVCACARDKCGAPLAPTRSRFTLRGSNVNETLYVPPENSWYWKQP
ncbi:unnamed protein product [Arctia plantaginis]|uniref:Uncharacterized protein n=1 Tax=Arctia plantaginis TaxID=874455 RepID=A0A8S0Z0U3_ARCPL|nr:unnamed protein product [Arctia plantaginis]